MDRPVVTIGFDRQELGTVTLNVAGNDFIYTGNVGALKMRIADLHRNALYEHLPRALFLLRLPGMLRGRWWAKLSESQHRASYN